MPYRTTDRTRDKKDAKRTAMMQAAVRVFAEKGYHAATVRDIVAAADVAIGTFYFYFPDKETLFVYLYEETADFLLRTVEQGLRRGDSWPGRLAAALQSFVNIATYEPAVVQLLLVGGVGAVPALVESRGRFRNELADLWQEALDEAIAAGELRPQNSRLTAQGLAGAFDEIVLHLLSLPEPTMVAAAVIQEMTTFALRATGYSQ
ncbi:MAG: TetR/AcrR family transcriptional regulator [Anaerolineae bacterium]|nr:TetR/AcrR family transcriptional regulator [Anaerolineae bacterium]